MGTQTLILGIETSCDETACAVVGHDADASRLAVLSSAISSQIELHAEYGGVVPEIASRAHAERILPVVNAGLEEARVELQEIGAVAVGHRPGLIGPLLVGVNAAKALAWALGVPLVGADHVHAHLIAGLLDAEPCALPALGLVVSGGHTTLYRVDALDSPVRLGGTIDDAAGEAFDKAASILGLGYPGGPLVERLAADGDAGAHAFPISRLGRDSLDFSFSGLKTSLLYATRGKPLGGGAFERDHGALSHREKADLAASFQRAAIGALMLKLERAHEVAGDARTLLVGGGVSANTLLRERLAVFAGERRMDLRIPEPRHCVDNAAMIAGLGAIRLAMGHADGLDLMASPTVSC